MTREEKIDAIVNQWLDQVDLDDLMEFFTEKQTEYLETLSDSEINGHLDLTQETDS